MLPRRPLVSRGLLLAVIVGAGVARGNGGPIAYTDGTTLLLAPRHAWPRTPRCWRLTIVEVAAGRTHDTCISEIALYPGGGG